MSSAKRTRDPDEIRAWVDRHGGRPAKVETKGEGGILRIDFDETDANLVEIDWEEFFAIFAESGLDFLYQDEGDSRFNKFVRAEWPRPAKTILGGGLFALR